MRPRLFAAAPLALALVSCVSAGRLNQDIAASEANGDLAVPTDPCPDGDPGADRSADRTATIGTLTDALSDRSATSDLSRGMRLIRASAENGASTPQSDPEARSFAGRLTGTTGMDLSQFAGQLDALDEAGANDAEAALASRGVADIDAGFAPSDGRSANGATTLRLGRSEWRATAELIARTTAQNGWTSAFARELGRASVDGSRSGASLAGLRKRYLVASYMAAYFRNGRIFALDFNQAGLRQRLLDKLKLTIKDENALRAAQAEIDRLAADYEKELCGKGSSAGGRCVILGVIGEQTFVTRAGKSYGFPGVTATVDPTADKKISTNKIAADEVVGDLVRVVFEGVADQRFRVPGAANSTMCATEAPLCGTDAQAGALARTNDAGDRAEAATTAIVGAVVRGGWLFSLNNETLARSMTVALSVTARKAAEAATWHRLSTCPASRDASGPTYRRLRLLAAG